MLVLLLQLSYVKYRLILRSGKALFLFSQSGVGGNWGHYLLIAVQRAVSGSPDKSQVKPLSDIVETSLINRSQRKKIILQVAVSAVR